MGRYDILNDILTYLRVRTRQRAERRHQTIDRNDESQDVPKSQLREALLCRIIARLIAC